MKRTLVTSVLLLSADLTFAAERYTRAQLDLAGEIGAAIVLAKNCGLPNPTIGVQKALRAAGLDSADATNPTEFSKRMEAQAKSVSMTFGLQKSYGASEADLKARACSQASGFYGKNGSIRAGLVED